MPFKVARDFEHVTDDKIIRIKQGITFMLPKLSLIIGGARSGKSVVAEKLMLSHASEPVYLASAQAFDEEMQARILAHKQQRKGAGWTTVEATIDIAPAFSQSGTHDGILWDCATLWLTNIQLAGRDLHSEISLLPKIISECTRSVIVVTNEIGQGIVPENALTREFRDAHGAMNQRLAAHADLVVQVVAGIPVPIKGAIPELRR